MGYHRGEGDRCQRVYRLIGWGIHASGDYLLLRKRLLLEGFLIDNHIVDFAAQLALYVLDQTFELFTSRLWQVIDLQDAGVSLHLEGAFIGADFRPFDRRHAGFFLKVVNHCFFFVGARANGLGCAINHVLVDAPLVEARVLAESALIRLGLDEFVEAVHGSPVVRLLGEVGSRGFFLRVPKLQIRCSHFYFNKSPSS